MPRHVVNANGVVSPYGPHVQAARSGPFLFLSGQLAQNPQTRRPVCGYRDLPIGAPQLGLGLMAPDSREGPGIAQTWQIFRQIEEILVAAGSTPDRILQMMTYMRSVRDHPSFVKVRRDLFAPKVPPPATAAQVAGLAFPQSTFCIDAIAAVPDPNTGIDKVAIETTRQFDQFALSQYELGSRVGDILFLAGVVAARPEKGKLIKKATDLDEEGRRVLAFTSRAAQDRDEAVMAQATFIYGAIDGILREHGASLADLVKTTIYLTDIRSLPAVDTISRLFLGPQPPATTVYEVQQLAMSDFLIEIDCIAVIPGGATRRQSFACEGAAPWIHQSVACGAGELVFMSGLMGEDPDSGQMPTSAADLTAGSLATETEGLAAQKMEYPFAAQVAAIYDKAARVLAKSGSDFSRVLRVTAYLRDMRDYPMLERLHHRIYGAEAPALMVCATDGLPLRDARLEIELVACQ